ncbi:cysteine proteinase, partial [Eremomyces bilateralis CBS 781.70]
EWLNDNVINTVLKYLTEAAAQHATTTKPPRGKNNPPVVGALGTQWFTTYQTKEKEGGAGAATMGRWFNRAKLVKNNLLYCKFLVLPVHLGNHWVMVVIEPLPKRIHYFDSMHGKRADVIEALHDILECQLYDDIYEQRVQWRVSYGPTNSQTNGNDCGVFSIWNAIATVTGRSTIEEVTAAGMPNARYWLKAVLCNGGFTGEFALPFEQELNLGWDDLKKVMELDALEAASIPRL